MKQNLIYKNIHIGAIATFYIIALLLRLISLHVVNKFPSIETSFALQIPALLATGLVPLSEHWWLCSFSNVKRNTLSLASLPGNPL